MGSNPFGIGEKPNKDDEFERTLFYLLKEIPILPFDEIFEVRDTNDKLVYTIKKKGLSIPMINSMIKQMSDHYKRENEANKRANRGR